MCTKYEYEKYDIIEHSSFKESISFENKYLILGYKYLLILVILGKKKGLKQSWFILINIVWYLFTTYI